MSIQTKFEDRLAEEFVPDHLEVVNNRQYANTGTIYIQPVDNFECVLSIRYSFQDNYCTFDIFPPFPFGTGYRIEGGVSKVHINAPFEKLNELLDNINKYLLGQLE